jgi:hypothetical protein
MPRTTSSTITAALALVLAALLALPALTGAHFPRPAGAIRCADVPITPNSDDVVTDIRARGVTCRVARRVARQQATTDANTAGYTCRTREHDDGSMPHRDVRCRRGASRVITFADF